MPIGENAIKRVENNGYSKVTTSAPDMENSAELLPEPVETAEPAPAPVKKRTYTRRKPAEKAAEVAAEPAPAPAKKRTYTRRKPVEKAAEKVVKNGKKGFDRVEIGEELPYWLL